MGVEFEIYSRGLRFCGEAFRNGAPSIEPNSWMGRVGGGQSRVDLKARVSPDEALKVLGEAHAVPDVLPQPRCAVHTHHQPQLECPGTAITIDSFSGSESCRLKFAL